MSFLFGKKQSVRALAEVLEDGRAIMNAEMKVSLLKAYLLKPGVRVRVQHDPAKKEQVIMDDEPAQILERNPQLKKSLYWRQLHVPISYLFIGISCIQYFRVCPSA
jgi:hypothetical protein